MENRNRSTGWQYAKLSGHDNEVLIKQLLDNNPIYANEFLSRIGYYSDKINLTSIGGLHEQNTKNINDGRTTKSKTDLKINLTSGDVINVSIKKSLSGQVYFVSAQSFIDTFENQFTTSIPFSIQRAIKLFWSSADDADTIIKKYADQSNKKTYNLQIKHRSLNASTLNVYDPKLYNDMLEWFIKNTFQISILCFASGAAAYRQEWAEYIWYKNMLGEHNADSIIPINKICSAAQAHSMEKTYYSIKNGGTTIQLPFGFVQWHQGKMQFHHDYHKILELLE